MEFLIKVVSVVITLLGIAMMTTGFFEGVIAILIGVFLWPIRELNWPWKL